MWIFSIVQESVYNLSEEYLSSIFNFLDTQNYLCVDFTIVQNLPKQTFDYIYSFFEQEQTQLIPYKKKESMIIRYKQSFTDLRRIDIVIHKYVKDSQNFYSIELIKREHVNIFQYLIKKLIEINIFLINQYVDNDFINKLQHNQKIKSNFPSHLLEYHQNEILFNDQIENFVHGSHEHEYDFDEIF